MKKIRVAQMAAIVMAAVLAVSVLLLSGCGGGVDNGSSSGSSGSGGSSSGGSSAPAKKGNPTLGDTIKFDDLEIVFDSTYSFVTVDNEWSDYYQKDVVRVGIKVTNLSEEKHSLNPFSWELFGSQGVRLDSAGSSFDDDAMWGSDDMKTSASKQLAFYIPYDGDGTYSIDFGYFSTDISVEFEVAK